MESRIAEIAHSIKSIPQVQFASLTYKAKESGEVARHTVLLGFSYHNAVEKSVVELEIQTGEGKFKTPLEIQAATEVMESLKKTLSAHAEGKQNEDYTKKGQYIPFGNGLNLNTVDNTIQLFGLTQTKVVLVKGEYKTVNSKPLTIEKNKVRKSLPIGKFREYALDPETIGTVKVNGQTVEFEPSDTFKAQYGFTVNPPSVTLNPQVPVSV